MFSKNKISFKQDRVVRIIIFKKNGSAIGDSSGTGFLVGSRKIFTCFHVAFGGGSLLINQDPIYAAINERDIHRKLEIYFQQKILKIEIELSDGSRKLVALTGFDEDHDGALLTLSEEGLQLPYFDLGFSQKLKLGDEVLFCGFASSAGYRFDQVPFAVYTGILSTFVQANLGQGRYEHMRINGISLEGISGAPVFKKNSNIVIGITNGNEGKTLNQSVMNGNNQPTIINFRVPLGIALSTPMGTLNKELLQLVED
jgi:Trypsin-like peptidase domain